MTSPTPNKKCIFCKLDLSTRKSFAEREDQESIKYCSSKCRKADMRNTGKMKKSKKR